MNVSSNNSLQNIRLDCLSRRSLSYPPPYNHHPCNHHPWTPHSVQHLLRSVTVEKVIFRIRRVAKSHTNFPRLWIAFGWGVFNRSCSCVRCDISFAHVMVLTDPCWVIEESGPCSKSSTKTIGIGWLFVGEYCFPLHICFLALRLQPHVKLQPTNTASNVWLT